MAESPGVGGKTSQKVEIFGQVSKGEKGMSHGDIEVKNSKALMGDSLACLKNAKEASI